MGYKDGDKLFPNKKRPSDFSAFVTKIFTKNTYKHLTATNLKSIYLLIIIIVVKRLKKNIIELQIWWHIQESNRDNIGK